MNGNILTSHRSLAYNQLAPKLRHPQNPICFFDIRIGTLDAGRISLELFADIAPKTAENFRQFCTGETKKDGKSLGYRGSRMHRVVKDFMVQGGDFVNGDGTGVTSIYNGKSFPDETFELKHDTPGLLSMANANAKDSNGCQFFITCAPCEFLDDHNVVFGRVVDGMLVLRKMENVPVGPNDRPRLPIEIMNCGEL